MAGKKRIPFEINKENLLKTFEYKKDTGELFWKHPTGRRVLKGRKAGCVVFFHGNPYVSVGLFRKNHLVHRLIWLIETGRFPKYQIDHIDGDTTNNRITNLRDVSIKEQSKNLSRRATNTSGVTGVTWDRHARAWTAQIQVDKKAVYLGNFKDNAFEEAVKARKEAEKIYGFHPNHDRVKA